MTLFGVIILIAGIALTFAVWLHDFSRLRIAARLPQAAPSRLPPETHALAALLSGLGTMIIWWWDAGIAVVLLQPALPSSWAPL